MCQIIHQKDPELLSKTIKATAKAWRQEKGPLKSTLNLFSSTLPIKNRTSSGSPTYNIGSIKFIKVHTNWTQEHSGHTTVCN